MSFSQLLNNSPSDETIPIIKSIVLILAPVIILKPNGLIINLFTKNIVYSR